MKLLYLTSLLILCQGLDIDWNFDWLKKIPKDFIFGASTSSYQVEGAWNTCGKGENIWDRLTHEEPFRVMDLSNGDIACDSYHLYKEDVAYVKEIGFDVYRFSLSWSRLFPTGYTSTVNQDGVRYYNALIDELLSNGIQPMVTLYHWDLPQPLEDIGGWLNPRIADIFGDYARAVFELFGDKVKWWLTINEPQSIMYWYGYERSSPGRNDSYVREFVASHNVLRSHAKAYRIYEREFKQKYGGKMSIVLSGTFYIPENKSDPTHVEAAERANQFTFGWYAHPIYSEEGDYPQVIRDIVDRSSKIEGRNHSRLPHFTPEEILEIKGTYDFMALNHYSTSAVRPGHNGSNPSVKRDQDFIQLPVSGALNSGCNDINFMVYPEGLRVLLNWMKSHYNDPHIIITENGYCDKIGKDNIYDVERINFHREYLKSMLAAINEDGCKVFGYCIWSLLDNLEWTSGFTRKFGLIKVDFDSPKREREMKLSAYFMKDLIQENKAKAFQ